jgi:hypothetical protein
VKVVEKVRLDAERDIEKERGVVDGWDREKDGKKSKTLKAAEQVRDSGGGRIPASSIANVPSPRRSSTTSWPPRPSLSSSTARWSSRPS